MEGYFVRTQACDDMLVGVEQCLKDVEQASMLAAVTGRGLADGIVGLGGVGPTEDHVAQEMVSEEGGRDGLSFELVL